MGGSILASGALQRTVRAYAGSGLITGLILTVFGSFFASRRTGIVRPRLARFAMALWGIGLALVLARMQVGTFLSQHAPHVQVALVFDQAGRWLFWFGGLAAIVALVRANKDSLDLKLWPLTVGLVLVGIEIVVASLENVLFGFLWSKNVRAIQLVLEGTGAIGLMFAGVALFVIGRKMHNAWITGPAASSSTHDAGSRRSKRSTPRGK